MKQVRRAANSIFFKVFMALLSITFISWGATSAFTGVSQNEVITVNGEAIFLSEVQQEYQSQLSRMRSQLGSEITPELEKVLDIGNVTVRTMVTEATLEQEAHKIGLRAAPKQMQDIIMSNQNFLDATGNFSREIYKQRLGLTGYNVNTYENRLRREIMFSNLASILTSNMNDQATLSKLANYAQATANINVAFVDEATLGTTPMPTVEEIAEFYQQNKQNFYTEETRSFDVININAREIMKNVTITEAEIEAEYNENIADYKTGEQREVRHILTKTEDEAKAAIGQLTNGESFETVAKNLSTDFLSKNKGGNLGFVEYADLVEEMADVAFNLEIGKTSMPVKSSLGFHVVEVLQTKEPRTLPLNEVKERIEKNLKLDKAEDAYYALLEQIEDHVSAGRTLKEIAEGTSVNVTSYTNLERGNEKLAAISAIRDAAFDLNEGEVSQPIDTDGVEAVAYVQATSITPSRDQSLEEAQNEILAKLKAVKLETALQERATTMLDNIKEGENFNTVVRKNGLKTETVKDITRAGTNAPQWLQRFHLANIFRLQEGEALTYPVSTDEGFALVSLNGFGDQRWSEAQQQAYAENVRKQMSRDLLTQFAGYMVQNADVEVKRSVLANTLGAGFSQ